MSLLLLLYIAVITGYIYYARRSVNKMIPTPEQTQKQQAHLKRLRQERLLGDFVLTGAAIPALENNIRPQEGYRIYADDGYFKINGGCLIVASVSAEKMKQLVLMLMQRVGTVLSMSIEDYYSDANKIIDYLSYDRDIFIIEHIIDRYWRLLQNNYDVQMSMFSNAPKVELVLTRAKVVNIHAVAPQPFVAALREAGLVEKPRLRLFTESAYYVYNDFAATGVLNQLTAELGVNEKRFYEKESITR